MTKASGYLIRFGFYQNIFAKWVIMLIKGGFPKISETLFQVGTVLTRIDN